MRHAEPKCPENCRLSNGWVDHCSSRRGIDLEIEGLGVCDAYCNTLMLARAAALKWVFRGHHERAICRDRDRLHVDQCPGGSDAAGEAPEANDCARGSDSRIVVNHSLDPIVRVRLQKRVPGTTGGATDWDDVIARI